MEKKVKLLFITQKIHKKDDDLAFVILWIKEFIKQGIDVHVICLEKGDFDDSFPVYSLGKEEGVSRLVQVIRFFKLIITLKYDRVFVHMNMEYVTLGGGYWFLMRKPLYIWYTHYTMHIHLWLAGIFSTRMFAATNQSLPQYNNSPKKIITGHGIDIKYWLSDKLRESPDIFIYNLVSVHRICRSKRLEIGIKALKFLPQEYNLSIYGRDVEKDYYEELQNLVKNESLQNRVFFKGPVPMDELKKIYSKLLYPVLFPVVFYSMMGVLGWLVDGRWIFYSSDVFFVSVLINGTAYFLMVGIARTLFGTRSREFSL
ncbi:glycosyltransferase [PVC group bacterium]|nr:glycosyltransferase [PVC group bacterium]